MGSATPGCGVQRWRAGGVEGRTRKRVLHALLRREREEREEMLLGNGGRGAEEVTGAAARQRAR